MLLIISCKSNKDKSLLCIYMHFCRKNYIFSLKKASNMALKCRIALKLNNCVLSPMTIFPNKKDFKAKLCQGRLFATTNVTDYIILPILCL